METSKEHRPQGSKGSSKEFERLKLLAWYGSHPRKHTSYITHVEFYGYLKGKVSKQSFQECLSKGGKESVEFFQNLNVCLEYDRSLTENTVSFSQFS